MGYPQPTYENPQSLYQGFRYYRNKAGLAGFSLFGMSLWQKARASLKRLNSSSDTSRCGFATRFF